MTSGDVIGAAKRSERSGLGWARPAAAGAKTTGGPTHMSPGRQAASADVRSSWYALVGNVAGALRDFETANAWLAKARDAAPHSAWVLVCLASLREAEDRYDEALAIANDALALRA